MENLTARETRTDSVISELAKGESNELAFPEESSSQGTRMMESVSSDWTDEKHHLFLESIEASFVSQLYSSMHSVGSGSLEENFSGPNLHGQRKCDSRTHFDQFKVLRHGSWKNINFEQSESRLKVLNETQDRSLSCNPWIHHFKAAQKHQNAACKNQAVGSRGRNWFSFGFTSKSRPPHACNSHFTSNTEMSDQNFVEEDDDVENESHARHAKRVRTLESSISSNDQQVP